MAIFPITRSDDSFCPHCGENLNNCKPEGSGATGTIYVCDNCKDRFIYKQP